MFHTYVASVLFGCCIAYVCNCFSSIFMCFCMCFKCFNYFVCMLQLFYLDVSKIDSGCCACCNVSHLLLLGRHAWRGATQQAWRGAGSRGTRASGTVGPCQCVQQTLGVGVVAIK
jgi:hypothetical protein